VIVFIVCCMSLSFCNFVCCVLFECGVLFCVLCVIVVPLPRGTNPFAVQINNNNNNIIIIINGLMIR
jgi:type IV secretory pathway component VirB8